MKGSLLFIGGQIVFLQNPRHDHFHDPAPIVADDLGAVGATIISCWTAASTEKTECALLALRISDEIAATTAEGTTFGILKAKLPGFGIIRADAKCGEQGMHSVLNFHTGAYDTGGANHQAIVNVSVAENNWCHQHIHIRETDYIDTNLGSVFDTPE